MRAVSVFRFWCLFEDGRVVRPLGGAAALWGRQELPGVGHCPSQDYCSAVDGVTTMEVKFSRYDTADYLKTKDDVTAYLDAVMEDGEPSLIAAALGDLARIRNLSQLARDVGISRQGLAKALSGDGDPSFATVVKVTQALGLRLTFKPTLGGPAPAGH